jgi:hypothetical protein
VDWKEIDEGGLVMNYWIFVAFFLGFVMKKVMNF